METVTFASNTRTGIEATTKCHLMGAIRKPTNATKDLAESEQKHYHQLQLASDEDGSDLLYAFADEGEFVDAAKALQSAGGPVPATVTLLISRGNRGPSVNVASIKL